MDATNPSSQPTMASRTPLRIAGYGLAVRDLGQCRDFYQQVVGLDLIGETPGRAVLGIAGMRLLTLEQRPDATPDDRAGAGLFHAAFAMPTRRDLTDWLRQAESRGLRLTRTGDHLVNEALYYEDPEGNGCECYADRPPATWLWHEDGTCEITTGKTVDLRTLADGSGAEAPGDWQMPAGLRVGHINLRVGDIATAEKFWCEAVGLDHTGRRDIDFSGRANTITFMSSGRYHHHVAANDFSSRGAGPRQPGRAGLIWFTIEADTAATLGETGRRLAAAGVTPVAIEGGFEVVDPWGMAVRFVQA